jgi:hypothetical protein
MKLWHLYAAIGVIALVLTGSQALSYFANGPIGGTVDFWRDALTGNDAGRFLTFDVALLATACFVLLWVEGRRLEISVWWRIGYILGAALIAASAFIPFFFAHRQRILDRRD